MKFKSEYIGIILGALYGLLFRLVIGDSSYSIFDRGLLTYTFLFGIPIIIGVVPILYSSTEIYKSKLKQFFYPIITVVIYIMTCLMTGIEDLVCGLILGFPALIVAGIAGLICGSRTAERENDKKLYSILLLPLFLFPIENVFPDKSELFTTESSIVVNNQPENIFSNLIEVKEIKQDEYKDGFYQFIDVPRPIKSTSFIENNQLVRIGKFTDDLELFEYVTELEENKYVNFKIDISKSKLRQKPTDQHVLKGNYFKFENINYRLEKINSTQTKITLSCEYQINSKLNWYGNFWAESIIHDFEKRLLQSLKFKLDSHQ